jgi:antitoxin ParD1/3/4
VSTIGDDPLAEERRLGVEQARQLRDQARKGGLRIEAYLTPDLAEWVLELVEKGVFISPGDAVFHLMVEAHELSAHEDLRSELQGRMVAYALTEVDAGVAYPAEEVLAELSDRLNDLQAPAVWDRDFLCPPPEVDSPAVPSEKGVRSMIPDKNGVAR